MTLGRDDATEPEHTPMRKFKIGRSAVSGRFTTVERARRYSRTHIVETIKVRRRRR